MPDLSTHPLKEAFPAFVLQNYATLFSQVDETFSGKIPRKKETKASAPSALVFPASDNIPSMQVLLSDRKGFNRVGAGSFGKVKPALMRQRNSDGSYAYSIVVVKCIQHYLQNSEVPFDEIIRKEAETAYDYGLGITHILVWQNSKHQTKYYYAMHYVGPSLERIFQHPLSDQARLKMTVSLLVSLYLLHTGYGCSSGIPRVHGDLKPSNICIGAGSNVCMTEQGGLVFVDFAACREGITEVGFPWDTYMIGTQEYLPMDKRDIEEYGAGGRQGTGQFILEAENRAKQFKMNSAWVDILAALRIVHHPVLSGSIITREIQQLLPPYLQGLIDTASVAKWFSAYQGYTLAAITSLWIMYVDGRPIQEVGLKDYLTHDMWHYRTILVYRIRSRITACWHAEGTTLQERIGLNGCYSLLLFHMAQLETVLSEKDGEALLASLPHSNAEIFKAIYNALFHRIITAHPSMTYLLYGLECDPKSPDFILNPSLVFYVLGIIADPECPFAKVLSAFYELMQEINAYATNTTPSFHSNISHVTACKRLQAEYRQRTTALSLEQRVAFFASPDVQTYAKGALRAPEGTYPKSVYDKINAFWIACSPYIYREEVSPYVPSSKP